MSSPGYKDDGSHSPNKGHDFDPIYSLILEAASNGQVSESRLFNHPLMTVRTVRWLKGGEENEIEPTHEVVMPVNDMVAHLSISHDNEVRFMLTSKEDPLLGVDDYFDDPYFVPEGQVKLFTKLLRAFSDSVKTEDSLLTSGEFEHLQRLLDAALDFTATTAEISVQSEALAELKSAIEDITANMNPGYIASNIIGLPDRKDEYRREVSVTTSFQQRPQGFARSLTLDYSFSTHKIWDDRQEVRYLVEGGEALLKAGSSAGLMDEIALRAQQLTPEDLINYRQRSPRENLLLSGYRWPTQEEMNVVYGILQEAAEVSKED